MPYPITYPIGVGHRNPIADAQDRASAARAQSQAAHAKANVERLESELGRLHLVCRSLWELLKEKTDLTDGDLERMIHNVDISDGKLDGQVRQDVVECTSCGRTIGRRNDRCLYCGTPRLDDAVF